jgi:hypothetical protein
LQAATTAQFHKCLPAFQPMATVTVAKSNRWRGLTAESGTWQETQSNKALKALTRLGGAPWAFPVRRHCPVVRQIFGRLGFHQMEVKAGFATMQSQSQ